MPPQPSRFTAGSEGMGSYIKHGRGSVRETQSGRAAKHKRCTSSCMNKIKVGTLKGPDVFLENGSFCLYTCIIHRRISILTPLYRALHNL